MRRLFIFLLLSTPFVSLGSDKTYDEARFKFYVRPDGEYYRTPFTFTVKDPATLKKLVSLFPNIEQKKSGGPPAGWKAAGQITFYRKGKEATYVHVNHYYSLWSEGRQMGDWPAQPEMKAFLNKVHSAAAKKKR